MFPGTRQQRCWVHKSVNILDKVPRSVQPKMKQDLREIYLASLGTSDRARPRQADGVFRLLKRAPVLVLQLPKIDRLTPIIRKSERIADPRNPPLNSGAQISDGSLRRFFVASRKKLR